jgi:hypothetical protein
VVAEAGWLVSGCRHFLQRRQAPSGAAKGLGEVEEWVTLAQIYWVKWLTPNHPAKASEVFNFSSSIFGASHRQIAKSALTLF